MSRETFLVRYRLGIRQRRAVGSATYCEGHVCREELIAYKKLHVDQSSEDQSDAERRRLFPWQTVGGGVAVNQQIRRKTGSLAQPGFAGEKGGVYPRSWRADGRVVLFTRLTSGEVRGSQSDTLSDAAPWHVFTTAYREQE